MKNQEEYEKIARKIWQKQFSNALQNDKGNAMLSSLIQQVCGVQIQEKVKKYCQKYVKQEMSKILEQMNAVKKSYSSSENTATEKTKDIYGLFSNNKQQYSPLSIKSQCKNCGSRLEQNKGQAKSKKFELKKTTNEKPKNAVEQTKVKTKQMKNKKTPFLKKIKSQQKIHFVKGDPINFTIQNNFIEQARQDKNIRLKKSKSQKTSSNVYKTEYSWRDNKNTVSPAVSRQVNEQKIRKVQRHLSKISDSNQGKQLHEECRLHKIIEDNGHLGSKEIAHLIKGMKDLEDISKVVKLQSNQLDLHNDHFKDDNPFHLPEGLHRVSKKRNEDYDFSSSQQRYYERERGQSEYITRAQFSPQMEKGKSFVDLNRKNTKSNKEKGKIFLKMLEIYGQDSRTQMFHFIQKNEHLAETQIISKWENELID